MRTLFASLAALTALLFSIGCGGGAGAESTVGAARADVADPGPIDPDRVEEAARLVAQGVELIGHQQCARALPTLFEPAIAIFVEHYGSLDGLVAGRTQGSLRAALEAGGPGARPVQLSLPEALYFRAYCLVELGEGPAAYEALLAADAILPGDPLLACELGHLDQARQDWDASIQRYAGALAQAERLAAEDPGLQILGMSLDDWRRRALRGIGFTQIELGQLEQAIGTYRRVLAIDPGDESALNELRVIEERRNQSPM